MRRRIPGQALAVLTVVTILLLVAGCGHRVPSDPFVGTWRDPNAYGFHTVIAKTPDGYRVTYFKGTWQHAVRHDDQIWAWGGVFSPYAQDKASGPQMVYTYVRASDTLVLTEPGYPNIRIPLARESTSTAIPSPWPTDGS